MATEEKPIKQRNHTQNDCDTIVSLKPVFRHRNFPRQPGPRKSARAVYVSVVRFLFCWPVDRPTSKSVIDSLLPPASSARATAKIDSGRVVFSRSQVKVRATTLPVGPHCANDHRGTFALSNSSSALRKPLCAGSTCWTLDLAQCENGEFIDNNIIGVTNASAYILLCPRRSGSIIKCDARSVRRKGRGASVSDRALRGLSSSSSAIPFVFSISSNF
jgi:hypothetical protein